MENQQPNTAPAQSPETGQPANGTMQPQASGEDPGKVFGILSIVMPFVGLALPGLVLGILGRSKSKASGHNNQLALIGIIISIIGIVIAVVIFGLAIIGISHVVEKCEELGPGTHQVDNVTYTCS